MSRAWRTDLAAAVLLLAEAALGWSRPAALTDTLGVAVWAFLAAWLAFALLLLRRRQRLAWGCHLAGAILLVPVSALVAERAAGAGGALGAGLDGAAIPD